MRIQATSRVLAVLGDPVAHSVSPVMMNAAIAALGLNAVYVALRVRRDDLDRALPALTECGIAGNLTVPLKVAATRWLELEPTARAVGAVNTFWPGDDGPRGDNTDVDGVLEACRQVEAAGPWCVQGTGGAARAVAIAAARCGVTLMVRSRAVPRAEDFVAWATAAGVDSMMDDGRSVGTVINASPLGLESHDVSPVPDGRFDGTASVIDLVYARGETTWVRRCRDRGCRAVDGRAMLVGQGAHAFERFFPDQQAPRDIMRAAVDHALHP